MSEQTQPLAFVKTEVKYLVLEGDEAIGRHLFELDPPSDVERSIWFFDTSALDLFRQGVILRARVTRSGDKPSDVTFKLRGPQVANLQESDMHLSADTKFEGDQAGTGTARPSYSLTVAHNSDEAILKVAGGAALVRTLFSAEQQSLITRFVPGATLEDVSPCGPVPSQTWNLPKGKFPHELTAELWQVGSRPVLEFSDKMDAAKAAAFAAKLSAFLDEEHIRFDPSSKTELALQHFAN